MTQNKITWIKQIKRGNKDNTYETKIIVSNIRTLSLIWTVEAAAILH